MELKKLSLVLCVAALSGCGDEQKMDMVISSTASLSKAISGQTTALNKLAVDDDLRVAKAIASSSKLSSIAAYMMQQQDTIGMTPDIVSKVLYASEQINRDQMEHRMYQSLMANGLPFSTKVVTDDGMNKTYSVRGSWTVTAPSGSDFYAQYPSYALELMPFERISYGDGVCEEGYSPIAVHALMKRGADVPDVQVHVQEQTKGWQVLLPDTDFYQAVKNYRVLLDVRCKQV